MAKRIVGDLPRRFWSYVDKSGDCWLWAGSTFWTGYGQLRLNNTSATAHRIAWELTFGPIPDGLFVCHKCDVRLCCNPAHLFLGTAQENVDDMMRKGRYTRDRKYSRGSHRPQSKLTESQVVEIVQLVREGNSQNIVAKMFGVSHSL